MQNTSNPFKAGYVNAGLGVCWNFWRDSENRAGADVKRSQLYMFLSFSCDKMRPFVKPLKREGVWLYVWIQASWHSIASWYPHVFLERMSTWEHFRALLCGGHQLVMSIQKQMLRDVYKPSAERLFSSSSSFDRCTTSISANCDDTDNLSLQTLLTLLQKATWDNHKIAIDQGWTAYVAPTV